MKNAIAACLNMRAAVAVYEPIDDGNDFVFKDYNRAAEEISRIKRQDIIGKRLLEVFPNIDQLKLLSALRRVYSTGSSEQLSAMYFKEAQFEIWSDISIFKLPNGEVVAIYDDVTDAKLLENQLKQSEEVYRDLYDNAPDTFVSVDATTGRIINCNQPIKQLTGYSKDEIIGRPVFELYHPDSREDAKKAFQRFQTTGKVHNAELKLVCKDSSSVDVILNVSAVYDDEGKIRYSRSILRDISDLKRAEEALRKSEEKYRLIADNTLEVIWQTDMDFAITYVNPAIERMMGYTQQEFLSFRIEDYCDEENLRKVLQAIYKELSLGPAGKGDTLEIVALDKNKRPVAVEVVGKVMFDQNGTPIGLQGVARDISERKAAELALQEREERFRSYFELPLVGIAITSLDKGWLEVNDALCSMLGYSREELLGMTWAELTYPQDLAADVAQFERVLRGEIDTYSLEKRFVRKNGDIIWAILSGSCVRKPEGPVDYFVALLQDITERKRMEEQEEQLRSQLLQSQKMEAVGTLAAGIAHDFNNMLQVILGYSDMLLSGKDKDQRGYRELGIIVRTALEARDLVQKIRLFSRKADIQPVDVDLNHQLTELAKLLSHTFLKPVELSVHLAENLEKIKADPALMDQMVTNLAINAAEAMPDGGTLTIETKNTVLQDEFCSAHAGAKPGPHVLLTISDTGKGMAKELLDRIFEPFFSTKQRDYHRGTGLGLSIVKGIVDEHSGYITVESEVGRGTIFKIYFPTLEIQQMPQAQLETKVEPATTGGQTILLVEDEELVRDLGTTLLERFGYKVIAVADGQEALAVYAKERENISLVILDIVMPRMDGKECLQELLKINPAVKVVISSGVAQEDRVQAVVKLGAKGSLIKPYGMKVLQEKVREIIDAEG